MIGSRREFLAAVASSPLFGRFSAATDEPTQIIPLWPDGVPGGKIPAIAEEVDDQIDTLGYRYRVGIHVTRPTLSWFAAAKPTGAAVLIIPGGGYSRVGIDREGYECARWMADMGIHAFVLRYRLPADRWAAGADVALQDAQRAMRLIRAGRSGGWTVDPQRVLVLGGSAGGHLAGSLCMRPNDRTYPMAESADHLSARPDGAILLYPVVTMTGATHGGSRKALIGDNPTDAQISAYSLEKIVPSTTPPMILFHSVHDRTVPVDQSLTLFGAVRAAQGAIDMHLFDEGSHGVGLRGDPAQPFADWPMIARKWQVRNGLV